MHRLISSNMSQDCTSFCAQNCIKNIFIFCFWVFSMSLASCVCCLNITSILTGVVCLCLTLANWKSKVAAMQSWTYFLRVFLEESKACVQQWNEDREYLAAWFVCLSHLLIKVVLVLFCDVIVLLGLGCELCCGCCFGVCAAACYDRKLIAWSDAFSLFFSSVIGCSSVFGWGKTALESVCPECALKFKPGRPVATLPPRFFFYHSTANKMFQYELIFSWKWGLTKQN